MSGIRGTIGNPEKDKVAAWIYDHVESMESKKRNHVFKLINLMSSERNNLIKIENWEFRQRMAKLVRIEFVRKIENMYGNTPLGSRLRNLAARNYRQSLYEN